MEKGGESIDKTLKKLPKYVLLTAISINFKWIDIIKEDLDLVGGPLSVTVQALGINKNLKTSEYTYDSRVQAVWYTKEELSKRKFSFSDLKKITRGVNEKKVDMHPFAKPTITNVLALC
jgi:hypothetical protein